MSKEPSLLFRITYLSRKNLKDICQGLTMFVTLVLEGSFLFFSTRKERSSFTNRDDHLQDLTESKVGVIILQPLHGPQREPLSY